MGATVAAADAVVAFVAFVELVVALIVKLVLDAGALVVGTPDGLDTVGGVSVDGFGAPVDPEPQADTTARAKVMASAVTPATVADCAGRRDRCRIILSPA